jgi:predicted DNA-binding transcriptional regulator AlpA
MLYDDEAARLARVLTSRLDQTTLTAVIAQLLDTSGETFERKPAYRSRQFREALGISQSKWYQLREQGKIPPGKKIGPQTEIWTEDQVLATIAALAAEHGQRDLVAQHDSQGRE